MGAEKEVLETLHHIVSLPKPHGQRVLAIALRLISPICLSANPSGPALDLIVNFF